MEVGGLFQNGSVRWREVARASNHLHTEITTAFHAVYPCREPGDPTDRINSSHGPSRLPRDESWLLRDSLPHPSVCPYKYALFPS